MVFLSCATTSFLLSSLFVLPSFAYDILCPIVLDGRVKGSATLQTFDTVQSPFNTNFVKQNDLKWSQIIKFPAAVPALFDAKDGKPIEITITDKSVYKDQTGFRRAGLLLAANDGNDDKTNAGVKTFHWSILQPVAGQRPLNLTHEYLHVWHETADYRGFQFKLQTGALMRREQESPMTYWKVLDRRDNIVWSTLMNFKEWQNFAITLDFNKNTMRVYYSKGGDELQPMTAVLPNDNSGRGRFQLGILKKGTGYTNELKDGYHEGSFRESQIYGSIFVEDSSNNGCITR